VQYLRGSFHDLIVIPGNRGDAGGDPESRFRRVSTPPPPGYRLEFILTKSKGRYDSKERNRTLDNFATSSVKRFLINPMVI
jgi:hypothetical protein